MATASTGLGRCSRGCPTTRAGTAKQPSATPSGRTTPSTCWTTSCATRRTSCRTTSAWSAGARTTATTRRRTGSRAASARGGCTTSATSARTSSTSATTPTAAWTTSAPSARPRCRRPAGESPPRGAGARPGSACQAVGFLIEVTTIALCFPRDAAAVLSLPTRVPVLAYKGRQSVLAFTPVCPLISHQRVCCSGKAALYLPRRKAYV
mmetsp:Transcript_29666/g.64757  ORF Transcript_29666/g.64757 Transcript_29666/m.64757 type:complete len:208 (-) Transcript_29666:88-711(-)